MLDCWLRYCKDGFIAFRDDRDDHSAARIISNIDDLAREFSLLASEYEKFKIPENQVEMIIERTKMKKVDKSLKLMHIRFPDGQRNYYGQAILEEEKENGPFEPIAKMMGKGFLDYKNQGFIYFSENTDSLPQGFCYERANTVIALGNYTDGYLNGQGIMITE